MNAHQTLANLPTAMLALYCVTAVLFTAVSASTVTVSWGFDTSQASIQVFLGDTVTWLWNQTAAPHTLISGTQGSPDSLFGVSVPMASGNYSYLFNQTGLYPYYCNLHSAMTGAIFVTDGKCDAALYFVLTTAYDRFVWVFFVQYIWDLPRRILLLVGAVLPVN